MKLVVNSLLGIGMQAIAEALALGEKAGLDRNRLLQVLSEAAVGAHMPATRAAYEVNAMQSEQGLEQDFSAVILQMDQTVRLMPWKAR